MVLLKVAKQSYCVRFQDVQSQQHVTITHQLILMMLHVLMKTQAVHQKQLVILILGMELLTLQVESIRIHI